MNNQKSILAFLFILCQMSIFSQTRVCFDVLGGSATIPEFTFTYDVTTISGNTTNLEPVKDGDCWLMTYPGLNMAEVQKLTINTEHDIDPLNGVSTFDMILIARHIVGAEDQECSNEGKVVKLIASDINNSGTITTFDLVQLRQLILHVISDFPLNDSWRFLNGNGLQAFANSPDFDINEVYGNNNLGLDLNFNNEDLQEEIRIVGLKVGDVNSPCN